MFPLLDFAVGFTTVLIGMYRLLSLLEKPRRRERFTRPQLEGLTERIVPSTLHHWTDATGDQLAGTGGNWDSGPILAGDSLTFDGTSGPKSNDPVTFDSTFTAVVSGITIGST